MKQIVIAVIKSLSSKILPLHVSEMNTGKVNDNIFSTQAPLPGTMQYTALS